MKSAPVAPEQPTVVMGQPVLSDRNNAARGWSSGLCECCSDFTSCCAVMFCAPSITGQLYQHIYRRPNSCLLIAGLLWFASLCGVIVNYILRPDSSPLDCAHVQSAPDSPQSIACREGLTLHDTRRYAHPMSGLLSIVACLGSFGMFAVTCMVRHKIRARDRIPVATCGGPCEDCLCACCCLCCVQAQLMRHEGFTAGNYALVSQTGREEAWATTMRAL